MIAVIMAGGLGTRLRPLTYSIPKPLLPVDEKPILEIIIGKLRKQGIRRILLTTGYRSELIHTYFRDGSRFGVHITYVNEDRPLGTAGALSLVRNKLKGREPFLVMNGDILTKTNFVRMRDFHRREKAWMTIATLKHRHRLQFGTLDIRSRSVTGIREKPVFRYDISAGIYILQPEAVDLIPRNRYFTMPDLVERLIADGRNVASYPLKKFWMAVEHMAQFTEALHLKRRWK